MRTRIFSGVEYMKATEIARMHHYAPDYIGQLCRSGKIEARLAGRTWYATEASFKAYQSGRYGGQTASAQLNEGRETTPTTRRETSSLTSGTALQPAPKIAVAKPKLEKAKQPRRGKTATQKKPPVAKAVPKRVVKKKAVGKPTKEKKISITAKTTPPPQPVSAVVQEEPKGIKGLFRKLFGR